MRKALAGEIISQLAEAGSGKLVEEKIDEALSEAKEAVEGSAFRMMREIGSLISLFDSDGHIDRIKNFAELVPPSPSAVLAKVSGGEINEKNIFASFSIFESAVTRLVIDLVKTKENLKDYVEDYRSDLEFLETVKALKEMVSGTTEVDDSEQVGDQASEWKEGFEEWLTSSTKSELKRVARLAKTRVSFKTKAELVDHLRTDFNLHPEIYHNLIDETVG